MTNTNTIPEGFTTDAHDAEVAPFRAMMAARIAKMGLKTTAEYLADTAHLVDPHPRAGSDWEFLAR